MLALLSVLDLAVARAVLILDAEQGMPLIDPEIVARTVVHLFAADSTGDAWFIQPGREPAAFAFRGIPGPRAPA